MTKLEDHEPGQRDVELWRKLRERFGGSGKWPDWKILAQAARELGYEDYARAWGLEPELSTEAARGILSLKRGTIDHPKTLELARVLKRPRRDIVGLLEMLFHFTAQYAPQGDIGKFSDKRIAAALDWQAAPRTLIDGLLEVGWIDADSRHRLVTHHWADHLDDATRKRLYRHGLKPVGLTDKVTGQRTDTSSPRARPALPTPPPEPEPEPSTPPPPPPRMGRGRRRRGRISQNLPALCVGTFRVRALKCSTQ